MDFKKYINKYTLILFFSVFYFTVRAPFFNMGWDGSDANGLDVDMFVNHPQKPNYLLIARMNGSDIYAPAFGHPAPMYGMFISMGYVLQKFENYHNLSDAQIIYRAKVIASIFQLLIFVLLLLIIFKDEKRNISPRKLLLYLGIFLVSLTPLAINNSNEFQIDSLFGLAMVGSYCITLAAYLFKCISGKLFYILLFLSSVFIALGKNEWSLLLIISLIACSVYLLARKYLFKQDDDTIEPYKIIGISLLGCIFGNVLSYLFEASLYFSGWDLLFRMSKQSSIFSKDGIGKLILVTQDRFIFIASLLAMIAYATFIVIRNIKKIDSIVILSYFISVFFFFSFFLSTWGSFSRYFAPSFAALLITMSVAYIKYQKPFNWKNATLFGLVLFFITYQSISYISDKKIKAQHTFGIRDISEIVADKSCVPMIPVEDVYNKKTVDFVHLSMGMEAAKTIAKEYGKEICPLN